MTFRRPSYQYITSLLQIPGTQVFYKAVFGSLPNRMFQSDFCLNDHHFQNYGSVRISPNEAKLFVYASSHPCLTLHTWQFWVLWRVYENSKFYFWQSYKHEELLNVFFAKRVMLHLFSSNRFILSILNLYMALTYSLLVVWEK